MAIWNRIFGNQPEHTQDPVEEILQSLRDGESVMLDVRSQKERDEGFIQDSIFINYDNFQSIDPTSPLLENLPKDKPIYCHWKAGVRAAVAAKTLRPMGYDIRTVPDSFEKLVEMGFTANE